MDPQVGYFKGFRKNKITEEETVTRLKSVVLIIFVSRSRIAF